MPGANKPGAKEATMTRNELNEILGAMAAGPVARKMSAESITYILVRAICEKLGIDIQEVLERNAADARALDASVAAAMKKEMRHARTKG